MAAFEMAAIAKAAMTSVEKVKATQKAAELSLMKKMKDLPENVTKSVKKSIEEVAKHPVETVSKIAVSAVLSHEAKDDPDIQDLKSIYNKFTAPKDLVALSKSIAEEVGLSIACEDPDLQDIAKVTRVSKTAYQVYKKIQNLPEHVEQKDSEEITTESEDVNNRTEREGVAPSNIPIKQENGKILTAEQRGPSDDVRDDLKQLQENRENNNNEVNIEKVDSIADTIAKRISIPEGINELIEKHPEKAELWKSQLDALETLNDLDASPTEIRSAQAKLSILKGQLMEVAVKDALTENGFEVEAQQRVVEGESGGTRPDVIAVNNTDHPIEVFSCSIQSGETLSIECKCGGVSYMTNQLNNHIPNQLSGQEGTKVLLTTSDIKGVPDGLATKVCNKYDAKLVNLDVSVSTVERAIKEVAEK